MDGRRRPVVPVEIEELALGFLYARREHWDRQFYRTMGRHTALRLGIVLPSPDRFWALVDRTADGCWEWQGPVDATTGYGSYALHGGERGAHRVAYTLAYGSIPKGARRHDVCVCHRCDNRLCCRPDHLFLGSQAENVADRQAKGRGIGGPNQPSRVRAA